jgi:hypothetical protein
LPRHLRAAILSFFVHVQTAQAPPVLALRSKNGASKIVQNCALFCTMIHHDDVLKLNVSGKV